MSNMSTPAAVHPATIISRKRKEDHLVGMMEDEFRNKVVIPIFERRGFTLLRDTCGPTEEGKDCLFLDTDRLGRLALYAVQTKRGPLNLSKKPAESLQEACVQLRTALSTNVPVTELRTRLRPLRVILCASGKINEAARRHILETLDDPRLEFYDANDIIADLDGLYPEFWYGIDADRFPYLRNLKEELLRCSDTIAISELGVEQGRYAPITDESFVTLYAVRIVSDPVKRRGQVAPLPKFEQRSVTGLVNSRDRLLLITGDAGAGKTTALRRIAFSLADRAMQADKPAHVPVVLRATHIAASTARLVELAGAETARLSASGRPAFSPDDLRTGRVTILVDALDEVVSDDSRRSVIQRIAEFHEENPLCQVLLTSRDYDFLRRIGALSLFSRYNLIPIAMEEAMRIVERVAQGRSLPKEQASEMLRRLQDVHGLALSPLLVTVFVVSSDFSKKDIPPNITEIFKKFTEMMLGRWDERKGFAQQYEAPLKDFLLQKLALHMHTRRLTRLSVARARDVFRDELEKRGQAANIDALFDEAVYRSSLLRFEGEDVEFRHHLLQEFFAGRGASVDHFKAVMHEEWWRGPITFYFGDNPSRHQDLTALIEGTSGLPPAAIYQAATTVGLALQASYLAEIADKDKTLNWVVEALAGTYESFLEATQDEQAPLHAFLLYYIGARDAVASDRISAIYPAIQAEYIALRNRRNELKLFWTIVGYIESGKLHEAEELVRKFAPEDLRLLLAILVGSFYVAHLRISTADEKHHAEHIIGRIRPRISHLISAFLEEFKGLLLEIRRGQLQVLDRESDTGARPVLNLPEAD